MDIESQEIQSDSPGSVGGIIFMTSAAVISLIAGSIYVFEEMQNNIVWRPHRAILGFVILVCLSVFICVPIGGIIEVYITNKGTVWQAIRNSYKATLLCICSLDC